MLGDGDLGWGRHLQVRMRGRHQILQGVVVVGFLPLVSFYRLLHELGKDRLGRGGLGVTEHDLLKVGVGK